MDGTTRISHVTSNAELALTLMMIPIDVLGVMILVSPVRAHQLIVLPVTKVKDTCIKTLV